MPEQGNKCNIPHLKVSLEAIFPKMIRANKKAFIFRQGNFTINVLHRSLSKSFALNICSRDPMKSSTLGYFCKSIYSQIHCKLQPWWLFGRQLLCSVLQVEMSHPHITLHVCQSLQIFMEKVTLKVLFHRITWKKIHFCGLKKETIISNGRKI